MEVIWYIHVNPAAVSKSRFASIWLYLYPHLIPPYPSLFHPFNKKTQKTLAPTWKFNMEHKFMEVWFRWFSFSFGWFLAETCQFSGVYTLCFLFFGWEVIIQFWNTSREIFGSAFSKIILTHLVLDNRRCQWRQIAEILMPPTDLSSHFFQLSKNVKIQHGKGNSQ